jgi:putative PIN family toxin of toxin-antitoxin system
VPDRVVFDCNVFVQSLISPRGPAGACVDAAVSRRIQVFASEHVLAEVQDVTERSDLVRRFRLTAERIEKFMDRLRGVVTLVDEVPHVFTYPRDPKDEHYVDLAIAVGARLVVSRDRDLLALADPKDPAGRDFQARFPAISVITPIELLAALDRP